MTERDPKQVLQAIDRLFITVMAIGLLALAAFGLIAWVVDNRLDNFESQARFSPPVSDSVSPDIDSGKDAPTESVFEIFVPAYSHIYRQDGQPFRLTVTLSVRNTDQNSVLVVNSVRYFDTNGKMVRSYLDQPLSVAPLGTKEFLVEEEDIEGGSGANFIVQCSLPEQDISRPLIEAVMIGAANQQGISFTSRGLEISK